MAGKRTKQHWRNVLFLFCGRRTDRIKGLIFEGDEEVYQWPRNASEVRTLTRQEYRWLLEGLSVSQSKAIKKAKKDDLILIENPEAHLHPKAQRIIGELLVKAARTDAQIIVETHSDHILNGIRICTKKQEISPEQVKIFFFMKEDVGFRYNVNIYAPEMDEDGNIDIWPEGFFDEWDNALAELF